MTLARSMLMLLAGGALLLAACGGGDGGDPADTSAGGAGAATATPARQAATGSNLAFSLEAADGHATLDVPDGALPEGVTPSDVSITAIQGAGEERFAVYRLEPDGMVPLEPLILTVAVDLAEGEAVSVVVLAADGNPVDGAAEIVGLTRASDDRPLDLVVRVHHLSEWIIGRVDGHLRIDIESLDDQLFGAPFTVRARVVRDPLMVIKETYLGRPWVGTSDDVSSWDMYGLWKASGPISPNEATNPGTGTLSDGISLAHYGSGPTEVVVDEQFTCDAKGDFAISLRVAGQLRTLLRSQGQYIDYGTEENTAPVSWSAKCVMPKIVASAAPPFTTYTLSPEIPLATSFAWSGANCGSVAGSTTNTMVWNHGEEDCEHAGEAHPDAQISVLVSGTFPVSGESFELRCTYVSAASGEGPDCTVAD